MNVDLIANLLILAALVFNTLFLADFTTISVF